MTTKLGGSGDAKILEKAQMSCYKKHFQNVQSTMKQVENNRIYLCHQYPTFLPRMNEFSTFHLYLL